MGDDGSHSGRRAPRQGWPCRCTAALCSPDRQMDVETPGTTRRGLLQSLPGSRDSFQSPPVLPPASSPSPGHRGTAWLQFFETPSDLERGKKPFSVSGSALKRDDLRRQSSAQPPAAFIARLWQQPSHGAGTLYSSPCQASHLTARGNEDQRCRPAPARPNPPQKLSSAGKYLGK